MSDNLALARTQLDRAKIGLMTTPETAFFTAVCFSLKHIFDDTVSTAATDGKAIFYNVMFFLGLSAPEQLFLLLHETLHVCLMHVLSTRMGNRCPDRWNKACDYVINNILIKRGFKMPEGGLYDPQYDGLSAEQVYDLLPNNPGKPMDSDLIMGTGTEAEAKVLEASIADILVRAQVQAQLANNQPGSIPGDIQAYLESLLDPILPWHRILQKYTAPLAKSDYSFRKPNRRFFPHHYLPSLYSHKLMNIAIAVDISGSVSDKDFQQCASETYAIIKRLKPETITFIQFDTKLQHIDELHSVQDFLKLEFHGRGGTTVQPVLDWAEANQPNLLLIFSDGYFRMPDIETKVPLIWLVYNNAKFTAPKGQVIHYTQ